mmetsp:Transcript_8264/g.23479  ORF Transcript_8264/g.23479 Transcript_8264/m.23479 type:complete len:306 (+) Transcript_8264:750-1667(+)
MAGQRRRPRASSPPGHRRCDTGVRCGCPSSARVDGGDAWVPPRKLPAAPRRSQALGGGPRSLWWHWMPSRRPGLGHHPGLAVGQGLRGARAGLCFPFPFFDFQGRGHQARGVQTSNGRGPEGRPESSPALLRTPCLATLVGRWVPPPAGVGSLGPTPARGEVACSGVVPHPGSHAVPRTQREPRLHSRHAALAPTRNRPSHHRLAAQDTDRGPNCRVYRGIPGPLRESDCGIQLCPSFPVLPVRVRPCFSHWGSRQRHRAETPGRHRSEPCGDPCCSRDGPPAGAGTESEDPLGARRRGWEYQHQ